jgi:mRNA-degrading endonuclease RelE of RelBE toxin-antitoxin system
MKRLIKKAKNLSNDIEQIVSEWVKSVERNNYEPFDHYQMSSPQEEFIDMMPYDFLDIGTYRIVFDLNDKVLKVALTPQGIDNIDTEVSTINSSPTMLKKHLAKVYDYGHGWLVMEKLLIELPQTEEYIKKVLEMETEFKRNGINPLDVTYYHDESEPNWDNLRLNEQGEIIIIDYGNFE